MKGKFALTVTAHRILGPLINPVAILPSHNREYFTVADRISIVNLRQYETFLTPEQVELVKIADEYSDNQLLKVFSKKKSSAQDFLASMDESLFEGQVRPYIERRIHRCIDLFSGSGIPVFLKKQHNNIYESDRLVLEEETAHAVFNFSRTPEGLQYYLTVSHKDEIIPLAGGQVFILVNDPCRLVLSNRIFQFDDIDGKKLLPFFKKKSLLIRKETERKFLETFAKPVIRKYRVEAEGFIINDLRSTPVPLLTLETSLAGTPVFMLRFTYQEKIVHLAGRKSELPVNLEEENGQIIFTRMMRDEEFENQVISSLLESGLVSIDSGSFSPLQVKRTDNPLLIYEMINWLNMNGHHLAKLGIAVHQNLSGARYYLGQIDLQISVSDKQNDWFDIQANVHFEGHTIPFFRLRYNIMKGIREFTLPDGRLAILPEEWFARFKDLFAFARDNHQGLILEKQHFPLLKEGLQGIDNTYSGKLKRWFDSADRQEKPVPVSIRAELRDYQKKGYNWMMKLYQHEFGGCLADDMGLGKTLQTLTLLQRVIEEEQARHCGPSGSVHERQLTIFDTPQGVEVKSKPSLVVVPSSLVHNWINEANRFAPMLKTGFYGGQNRRQFGYYYNRFDLIISSYGLVRNDLDVLKNYEFLYLILDESQVVKNPHAKTYRALITLQSRYRLVLTGTPIENSLGDLWAQMNFVNPGLLGNYEFFKNQFANPIEKDGSEKQTRVLQTLIRPFVLRRTKSEVARELPALTRQTIYCEMSESQQAYYETEKSKARNLILDTIRSNGMEKSSFVILQSLTRLRQAANHPLLIDGDYSEDSGKHEVIIENICNIVAEGHKALIFSSFVKHLSLYTAFCDAHQFRYTLLTGEVPLEKREKIIEEFQQDEQVNLFFISIKSGGFGLNLTAADYVFILDPWWNPAVEEQALSRAHRIGQKKKVFVYRFIARNTLEEKILVLQEKKSKLAGSFIHDSPLRPSDEAELLQLLE